MRGRHMAEYDRNTLSHAMKQDETPQNACTRYEKQHRTASSRSVFNTGGLSCSSSAVMRCHLVSCSSAWCGAAWCVVYCLMPCGVLFVLMRCDISSCRLSVCSAVCAVRCSMLFVWCVLCHLVSSHMVCCCTVSSLCVARCHIVSSLCVTRCHIVSSRIVQ